MSTDVLDRPDTFQKPAEKRKVQRPKLFKVSLVYDGPNILYNGKPALPVECAGILVDVFKMETQQAGRHMLESWETGISKVFEGSEEIAETREKRANDQAEREFPDIFKEVIIFVYEPV